jgi:hypothetical protein
MDMKEYAESEYLTSDKIKKSETKKGLIVSDVELVEGFEKGTKVPQLRIDIDNFTKKWKMNKTSVQNLIKAYGEESKGWLGKEVIFSVVMASNNKPSIVGETIEGN